MSREIPSIEAARVRGSEPTAAFAPSGPTGSREFLAERLALFGQRAKRQHRTRGRWDIGEVWPDDVVENVGAQAVEHRADAAGRHAALGGEHGQRVGEEAEAGDVVEVSVADEGVFDVDLLGGRQGSSDRACVYQNPIVDEQGRGSLPWSLAAVRAENLDLHAAIFMRPPLGASDRVDLSSAILVYQPSGGQV